MLVARDVSAQATRQFRYTNFGTQQGLNAEYIYSCTQDQNNKMWFGTQNGLVSFDNKYFKHAKPKNQLKGKDINNLLQTVYFDKKTNLIWCGSFNYFLWFNPINQQFTSPNYNMAENVEVADNAISIFFRDSKNRMWIGTSNGGLRVWDETKQAARKLEGIISDEKTAIIKIFEINNAIWVTTQNGIYLYNETEDEFKPFTNTIYNYFSDGLYDKPNNCIWMTTPGFGLFKFDLLTKQFENYKFDSYFKGKFVNHGVFNSLTALNDKELLIEGNIIYNKESKHFTLIDNTHTTEAYKFRQNVVVQSFKDREQNIWLCSHTGLSMLSWQNFNVSNLVLSNPINDFSIEINQVLELKEKLWYWSRDYNGLMSYDLKSNSKSAFTTPYNAQIYCIMKYDENTIWLGTSGGLITFNTKDLIFKSITKSVSNALSTIPITYLYKDPLNNVWINYGGHGLYLRKNNQTKQELVIDFKNIPNANDLYFINPNGMDKSGNVWCYSSKGIFKIDINTYSYKQYFGKVSETGNSITEVKQLVIAKNDHVWFTDIFNGLSEMKLNEEKVEVVHHTNIAERKIYSTNCSGLALDENGYLWCASLEGIICYHIEKKEWKGKLQKKNGLTQNSFSRNIYCINNKMVILNWSGIDLIDLREYKMNNIKPDLLISSIKFGNKSYTSFPKNNLKQSFENNSFSFEIGTNLYNNGEQNTILYQLKGIDATLQQMGVNYQLTYASLPPGQYQLELWAENNNGLQGEKTILNIEIVPPFYRQTWFILLSLFLLITLIYYLYLLRIKTVRREAKLKAEFSQKIAESEMKALRAQMNPHFMFNALNSIQKFILKNETQLASGYLTKFSRLIRLILEQSAKNCISLSDEITLLTLYADLEKMRFDNQFEFKIQIHQDLSIECLFIPSMIIQPYIENAIWHGLLHKNGGGKIALSMNPLGQDTVQIIIEDNGIGREKAAELNSKNSLKNKSFGMGITQERLSLLKENISAIKIIDLKDQNQNPIGTKIVLIIPYLKSSLAYENTTY